MNKFGMEFMNKFECEGFGMSNEEFFGSEFELIDEVVNKSGWYEYVNCRGYVEIEYKGEVLENYDELREEEKLFISGRDEDGNLVYDESDIREGFIDIEEVCYVYVKGE